MDNKEKGNWAYIYQGVKYTKEEFKELCKKSLTSMSLSEKEIEKKVVKRSERGRSILEKFFPLEEVPLSEEEKKEFEEEWSKLNWGEFRRVILGEWTEKATEKKLVKGSAVGITEGIMNQSVYYAPVGEKESETIKQWADRLKFSEAELEYQKALLKNNRRLLEMKEDHLNDLKQRLKWQIDLQYQFLTVWKDINSILVKSEMSDSEKLRTITGMMKKRAQLSKDKSLRRQVKSEK